MLGSKWLGGLALAAALAVGTPAWAQSWQQQQGTPSVGQICPMYVSGTQVQMADANGQIELVFSTGAGDVRDLQQRTHQFADALVQPNPSEGGQHPMMMGMMAKGAAAACSEMMGLPEASVQGRATVENTRDGARIVFQPRDRDEATALRSRLHLLAAELVTGTCPPSTLGLLAPSQSSQQRDQQQKQQQQQRYDPRYQQYDDQQQPPR